jgi:hypothetical protein
MAALFSRLKQLEDQNLHLEQTNEALRNSSQPPPPAGGASSGEAAAGGAG